MRDYLKLENPVSDQEIFTQNILIFVSLSFAYIFFISPLFTHSIFPFLVKFDIKKIISAVGILILFNSSVFFIKDSFLKTIWFYVFNLQLQGALVYYAFAPDTVISIVFQNLILLLLLFGASRLNISAPSISTINIDKSFKYILILSAVLLTPFIYIYGKHITLDNLMFQDIYKTRLIFRNLKVPFLGYLISPLSRVLLPAVLVISIYKKKFIYAALAFTGIAYLFLCGATKSILIGAVSAIFFYPGKTWLVKTRLFTHLVLTLFISGLVTIVLFNNSFIYDAFIRRVFFVPPYLDNLYHQYFVGNYTLWKHSSLAIGAAKPDFMNGQDLTLFFGSEVMKKIGMNANIGVITEGFISFGYLGVLVHSLFYVGLFVYIKILKISPIFFGILFSYLFYLNTSLVSTLILTHGLFFLIFFLTFFLKDSNNKFRNRPW